MGRGIGNFRFGIEGNKKDKYYIKIGMDWDGHRVFYINLIDSAFADYVPILKFRYDSFEEAKENLKLLKAWLLRWLQVRGNSFNRKKFMTQLPPYFD